MDFWLCAKLKGICNQSGEKRKTVMDVVLFRFVQTKRALKTSFFNLAQVQASLGTKNSFSLLVHNLVLMPEHNSRSKLPQCAPKSAKYNSF